LSIKIKGTPTILGDAESPFAAPSVVPPLLAPLGEREVGVNPP